MPHNLFLHSALVQTRNLKRTNKAAVREGNYYFCIEGGMSLFVSFFINLFIVTVFAKGFNEDNTTSVDKDDIGLKNAGDVLGERFGEAAKIIWGVGLLAAGQASTMTGTFAGQYCMSGFLEINWEPWKRTLFTRSFALGPALLVAISAQDELDEIDEWLNVQQSVQLPFALLPLLFFNCNPRVMGEFAINWKWEIFFWTSAFVVVAINVYLTCAFIEDINTAGGVKYTILALLLIAYLGFCVWLMLDFCNQKRKGHSRTLSIAADTEFSDRRVTMTNEDNGDNSMYQTITQTVDSRNDSRM